MASRWNRRLPMALVAVGLLVAAPGIGSTAHAHKGATGVVKQRMDMMKSLASAMKQLAAMFRNKRPYNAAQVASLARVIAGHANRFPKMFPQGTNQHPSEAVDAIWTDWSRFMAAARQMHAAALRLEGAAAGPRRDARRAFAGVARTCRTCHTDFRKKK